MADNVTERIDMYGIGLLGTNCWPAKGCSGSSSSAHELVEGHLGAFSIVAHGRYGGVACR